MQMHHAVDNQIISVCSGYTDTFRFYANEANEEKVLRLKDQHRLEAEKVLRHGVIVE
jgi:hypothetical protein